MIQQLREACEDQKAVALHQLDHFEGPGLGVGDEDGAEAGISLSLSLRPALLEFDHLEAWLAAASAT